MEMMFRRGSAEMTQEDCAMKRWLSALLALLMLCTGFAVQAEERKIEYTGGVVLRMLPKGNEAPGDEYINVGFVECSMPYLLLGHMSTWQLGVEGGQAPYDIEVILWRRPFDATDGYYWYFDSFSLGNKRSFNYVFDVPGDYFWEIAVTDSAGQTLVFQTRPVKTVEAEEESDAQTVAGKVNQIIAEHITSGMSEYQRALVLHDWLIYNANYDYTFTWYEPEGVLLHGTGVCDSYARAYQMLCTAAGLECIYVSGLGNGGAHGWNLVKIDGKWYHVDCTWDDPGTGGYECHDYFLLTDEEMGRDHDWNFANRGDMIVPDAEDKGFEGGSTTDCDFTFTTMAECAEGFRQLVKSGEHPSRVVAMYTGDEDIYAIYDRFREWAKTELSGILGSAGWWREWRATGNCFFVTVNWNDPTEYVRFNEEKVILSAGEEKEIAAADYYPAANAFTWTSSDPSVVTVKGYYNAVEGLRASLKAVSGGSAVITVTSKDGVSDSFTVEVMPAFTPDFHLTLEPGAGDVHLVWQSIPGVTEYHIMRAVKEQEDCIAIVEDHEATLTQEQLPPNVKQEVWIVGLRIVGGQVMAEYCGEHMTYGDESLPVKHTPVVDAAVAATCTQPGLTEGAHCSQCGAVITAQETIPALGHAKVTDAAVAATCTQPGLTEGAHCSRCEAVITAQETIPALGHAKVTDAAVTATCTQPGLTEGAHCSRCEAVITAQETIPALGHEPVTESIGGANCTEGASLVTICGRCLERLAVEEILPLGHDEYIVEGVPATHVTTGLTDLIVCKRCGAVLQKQETIPAVQVTAFTVPGMVHVIDAEAFMGCRFECVVIGEGCRTIGASAFADNGALRFVEIPASVTDIAPTAFDGCSEGLIIVTTAGSAAEAFARANGLVCVIR